MSLVHHENAEKHIISGDSGNEPEDSNRQEDGTKKHSKCFSHSDLLLVSRRYAYGSVTKRWQAKRRLEFIRNGDAPELSKIDNMRLFRFAYLLLLCLAAAAEAQNSPPATTKTAVFAGGCFWCIQPAFDKAPGVLKTTVGYCGGTEPNPTYALVGSEKTNYRESIQIAYDPAKISYEQLLDIYWKQIDPTQSDGQFTDVGPSYRAAIFYGSDEEKKVAETSKEKLAHSGKFKKPIVTEILPAMKFYPAEDYHQKYYQQNPEHFKAFEHGSGRVSFQKKNWGDKP